MCSRICVLEFDVCELAARVQGLAVAIAVAVAVAVAVDAIAGDVVVVVRLKARIKLSCLSGYLSVKNVFFNAIY